MSELWGEPQLRPPVRGGKCFDWDWWIRTSLSVVVCAACLFFGVSFYQSVVTSSMDQWAKGCTLLTACAAPVMLGYFGLLGCWLLR